MFREIFLRITSYDDHLFLVACTSSSKHCFTVYACTHARTARHGTARHGTARHGTAPHRTVCIHEISSLSLCCTGNIIFFVIFTHSIHKFLNLSLIPPHKNHPARRSGRSPPGKRNGCEDLGEVRPMEAISTQPKTTSKQQSKHQISKPSGSGPIY